MTLPTFDTIAEAISNGQRVFLDCGGLGWPPTTREVKGYERPYWIYLSGWTDSWTKGRMFYPQSCFSNVVITEPEPDTTTNRKEPHVRPSPGTQ